MSRFWIQAMGDPRLYASDAEEHPLISGKPVALLAYLALAPDRRCDRDRLAELFWRSAESVDARHSLRQTLYRLRTATTGVELVEATDGELRLVAPVRLSCLEGEEAAAAGDLERAVELLRSGFLHGFSMPESTEFESWADAQRSRFEAIWVQAATSLAERRLAAGDAEGALGLAEELVARRPFDDGPQRLLLASLAATGRHAAALARYQMYADFLSRELEDEPGEELREYARELEAYVGAAEGRPTAELPFVGRDEEWALLEAAWSETTEGRGTAILVEGAAGLGKTRLIAELLRRVEAGVGLVLHAKCYEIENEVPYAAVAEALAGAVDDPALDRLSPAWLAEAARLLPELRERFPDLPRAVDGSGSLAAKRRLHRALAACLEALATERGVLVAVDDVHWADAPSLEVLHLLAQRLEESAILVALSYRPAELSPTARRFARAVLADQMARLVVLEPLTIDDVENLLTGLGEFSDSGIGKEVARHLHRHSAGNPLFVSELLEALERGGLLTKRDGTWSLTGTDTLEALPATLGKLIADRVDRLEPWMRACLETMAVAGDEVPAELLAGALRISEPRAEVALAALREERLARPTATGGHEILHDELRRLVYQGIPDGRRRVLHAAVGSALEAAGEERRPGGAARLAHHFDQAGDAERAHRYACAAAEEADAFAAADARRAHLEVATAHSPRALPPGTDVVAEPEDDAAAEQRGRDEGMQRAPKRWLGAAAVLLIGAALVGLSGRLLSSGAADGAEAGDYRQGRLYLGETSETTYGYELAWPDEVGTPGRIRALPTPPEESPPRIVRRWVNEAGETHAKLFRATEEGLQQITFGPSDDGSNGWSPDRRFLLVNRGWRTQDDHFRVNLALLDSAGRERARLTDTRYQDQWGLWSPTGTQIACRRDSLGSRTLWLMDADGARGRDLTTEYRLPTTDFQAGFSPDGKRLAVVYPDMGRGTGGIYVLDLTDGSRRMLPWAHEPRVGYPVLWSPDGHWVAYVVPGSGSHRLWTTRVDGSEGPHLLAELPQGVVARAWRGDADRYLARIELEPSVFELRSGEGVSAAVRAYTPGGELLDVPFRWSVSDTTVARVDGRGFVVGRRPGAATLVATAGGLVADTAVVTVRLAAVDTVFVEDWRDGLDESVWRPFGQPAPRVVPGGLPDGRPAFFAAGDYNHHSGVLSRSGFVAGEDGYTVEAEARLEFDGRYWQYWDLRLAPDTVRFEAGEFTTGTPLGVMIGGPNPTREQIEWSACTWGEEQVIGKLESVAPPDSLHHVAIQVRPDGVVECFLDGTLLASGGLPASLRDRPLLLGLMAQSEFVRLYHGRVVVTRGLRY